ncbi:MAG: zinc ribbon domain-containing protein [Treponema sp.]|jgi:rubredoxin|nr:zinc ribbon domain-containing protein [Treponema sp.]
MAFCDQCGEQLNEGAKFCGKCGAQVGAVTPGQNTPTASSCNQCGAPLEAGEGFCANCGAKVGGAGGAAGSQSSVPMARHSNITPIGEKVMKIWVCSVCGYVHRGGNAPDACLQCKAPAAKFKEQVYFMEIEDVFSIFGRGTIVTGTIENYPIKLKEIIIISGDNFIKSTVVTEIESFNKPLKEAIPGNNVGLLLKGIRKDEIKRGYILSKDRVSATVFA